MEEKISLILLKSKLNLMLVRMLSQYLIKILLKLVCVFLATFVETWHITLIFARISAFLKPLTMDHELVR